jgi:endonuclease/exonuclease/phosphatase family metal-dependent hydrolase
VFFFFNSHFDHQGTVARYESAKLLVSRIHAIAGEAPTFSTGDYNASPSENSIMHILYEGLLRDSRAVSETEPTGTAGTFSNNSLTLEQMVNRIDYIFVTQGISVKSYGTLNERHDGKYPSDHDPVMITVEL